MDANLRKFERLINGLPLNDEDDFNCLPLYPLDDDGCISGTAIRPLVPAWVDDAHEREQQDGFIPYPHYRPKTKYKRDNHMKRKVEAWRMRKNEAFQASLDAKRDDFLNQLRASIASDLSACNISKQTPTYDLAATCTPLTDEEGYEFSLPPSGECVYTTVDTFEVTTSCESRTDVISEIVGDPSGLTQLLSHDTSVIGDELCVAEPFSQVSVDSCSANVRIQTYIANLCYNSSSVISCKDAYEVKQTIKDSMPICEDSVSVFFSFNRSELEHLSHSSEVFVRSWHIPNGTKVSNCILLTDSLRIFRECMVSKFAFIDVYRYSKSTWQIDDMYLRLLSLPASVIIFQSCRIDKMVKVRKRSRTKCEVSVSSA